MRRTTERFYDMIRDFVLDGEDVRDFPVIALGPEMKTIAQLNQLDDDSDPIARSSNAALQNMFDVKPLANFYRFDVLPLKKKPRKCGQRLSCPARWRADS